VHEWLAAGKRDSIIRIILVSANGAEGPRPADLARP
jgi:hypothetical protein